MKNVIDFYLNNKEWIDKIIFLLISIISTILVIVIKKKRIINDMDLILLEVFERLPDFINQAEFLSGPDVKKEFVLKTIQEFVKNRFSVNLPDSVMSFLGTAIENILSTPQKHS